jgi:hypothetical protein
MVLEATRTFVGGGTPEILIPDRWVPPELAAQLRAYAPRTHLGRAVQACLAHLPPEQARELLDRILGCVVIETSLAVVVFRSAASPFGRGRRELEDYGVVSRKVVTDTGVGHLIDARQNLVEPEVMNYHGLGTGGTAEAASQTALVTELTTAYNPDSTRATGTQSEPASNQYRSVGTNTVDATAAVTEHGLFSQAAGGGGVMYDRSLFSVVNLASGDSLQSTWTETLTSGG